MNYIDTSTGRLQLMLPCALLLLLLAVLPAGADSKEYTAPCINVMDFCNAAEHAGFRFSPDGCNICYCTAKGDGLDTCTMMLCSRHFDTELDWQVHCEMVRSKANIGELYLTTAKDEL